MKFLIIADIAMNWSLLFTKEVNLGGKFIHHVMMVFWLVLDILLNCLIGLTPFVDNFNRKYFQSILFNIF